MTALNLSTITGNNMIGRENGLKCWLLLIKEIDLPKRGFLTLQQVGDHVVLVVVW